MTTLRERIMEAAGGRRRAEGDRTLNPSGVLSPSAHTEGQDPELPKGPVPVTQPVRRDLRGCSGCRKKMLAKMRAKRRRAADGRGERR